MSLISKRKGQFFFAGLLLLLAVGLFFLWRPMDPGPESPDPAAEILPEASSETSLKPMNRPRRIVDHNHREVKDAKIPPPQNMPSPEWRTNLESTLLRQGGSDLQNLKVTPLESLVWLHEGKSLNVETARVEFKGPSGRLVSFKAMVDSQTGKVLQTWDQPVIDDFSGKEKSGIKLDPRYLGQ